MNKEFYQNRIGIFPIFWGSRRKERDLFFFTSQVESQEEKKKRPPLFQLYRYPLYRSFSASSRKDGRDYGSIKEKKRVSDQREIKNNQIQSNEKKSSLFGFEKRISHVVENAAHDRGIQDVNVPKKWQGNWSKKKGGVLDQRETKNKLSQGNKKESSLDPTAVVGKKPTQIREIKGGNAKKGSKDFWSQEKKGVLDQRKTKNNLSKGNRKESTLDPTAVVGRKPSQIREIKGGNVKKGKKGHWSQEKEKKAVSYKKETNINNFPLTREESSVDFKVIGVEKVAQKRRIKGENVQKKKNDFRSREKKVAYQKLNQAQSLDESKKSGHQSHLKDQNLQRKDENFHNGPDHQKQIKVSNLKGNKKISHDNRKFNKRCKQPGWINNRADDKYSSVRDRLKKQMKLGVKEVFEKQVTVVQGFFPVISLPVEKKTTQVERCFAIQQKLYGQTDPAVVALLSKKLNQSHYIATVNSWFGGKAKLSDNNQSKGIKILDKNLPKSIKLQQIMHKSLPKAKPVMHKSPPKGNVLYRLGYQKSKRGASHQASSKHIINRWLSMEVKSPDKIKTKHHKKSHKSLPKSKGLHRVRHKNFTKKSNLQGRSHEPYFKFLLEGTPQTSSNYRIIAKVNKMWCMAQKIVIKTQKLLQQQNKKIENLQVKLVNFYQRKEIAKDCEIKFINKFRNMLMRDGKKSKACTTLFKSLKLFRTYIESMSVQEEFLQKWAETESDNYTVHCLQKAVENVKPSLEVRRKKISGILRQIPAVPSEKRQQSVSIRWIIESARKRKKKSSKPFFQCLAEEFLDAYKNQGEPYKKKRALHDTAEASRIYIRYRWW